MKIKLICSLSLCFLFLLIFNLGMSKVSAEEESTVTDQTAPVISGSNEFTTPNTSLLSVEAIKNSLTVTDNIDDDSEITLSVKYDYYTSYYSKPGTYRVCFIATDSSGNSSEFVVTIHVVDRNAPVFYDEYNAVIKKYEVKKSLDSVLVMSDIINQIKAVDSVDGEISIEVYSDKYTGNGDLEGTYLIILRAVDKTGNVAYLNVSINVSSEMPTKTILIGNKLVLVDKTRKLTKTDFHTLIKLIGLYDTSTQSYTTINDDIYSTSYKITGEYLVDYNIKTTSGTENDGVFTVRVIESRTTGTIIDLKEIEESDDGIIISILKWIWSLIEGFFGFIASLFT